MQVWWKKKSMHVTLFPCLESEIINAQFLFEKVYSHIFNIYQRKNHAKTQYT